MKQPNLIIALLAVLLSSATLQLKAQQQVGTEFTLGEFTYRILNNTTAWEVEVAGFNGTGNAYIPDYTENGYAVIGIGDYAFYNDLAPRTINIPQTVKYIGDYAFYLCSSIEEVNLPEGLTKIGHGAFDGCSLKEITIPESVTFIGDCAFRSNSKLTDITLPKGITSISYGMFEYSSICNITIPENVMEICSNAFTECKNLLSVTLLSPEPPTVDEDAFARIDRKPSVFVPEGSVGKYKESEGWKDFEVRQIAAKPVSSIEFGEEKIILNIGDSKQLAATVLPEDADYKELSWSSDYPSIASVDENGMVTAVGTGTTIITAKATDGSGVTATCTVTVIKPATSITLDVNELEITKSSTRQLSATVLPEDASIRSVTWSSDNEEIATVDEYGDVTAHRLGKATITATTTDGSNLSASCVVTVIPRSNSFSIGDFSFKITDADKMEVTITNYLGENIDVLTVPATVTYDDDVFTVTSIDDYVFQRRNFKKVIIPYGVKSIGVSAFSKCSYLTEVDITESVTYIGEHAFDGCRNLKEIAIPNGITGIEPYTFYNCSSLEKVSLPGSVTYIGGNAFCYCESLSEITLPENLREIGEFAFYCCYNSTSITIPGNVTSIGKYAFANCNGISEIIIPEGVTNIGERAFFNCENLASVTLPESLTRIEQDVFSSCKRLEEITIPANVSYIGHAAFFNCDLKKVTVLAETPPILEDNSSISGTVQTVYVPAGSVEAYKNAEYWRDLHIEGITTSIESVEMPGSVSVKGGVLYNPEGLAITVYDTAGQEVYKGRDTSITQPAGVYIIRCGQATKKVKF